MDNQQPLVLIDESICGWCQRSFQTRAGQTVEVWARGRAWSGDDLLSQAQLADWALCHLAPTAGLTLEEQCSKLAELNGFFALIMRCGSLLVAATDRMRSIPLFYGSDGNRGVVGNSADAVARELGDISPCQELATEFLLAGLVTGQDTLLEGVKQMQAAEALRMQRAPNGQVSIRTRRHFLPRFRGDTFRGLGSLMAHFDEILGRVFSRLIALADGRPIVVPLSGGFDSRLVVATLKRLGARELAAFSYGVTDNLQARLSQAVAERLGIAWHFAPYTRAEWRAASQDDSWHSYLRYGGQSSSIAHIQDWLALRLMQGSALFDSQHLVVPGHHAGFSGGHVWPSFLEEKLHDQASLQDQIIEHFYGLWHLDAR